MVNFVKLSEGIAVEKSRTVRALGVSMIEKIEKSRKHIGKSRNPFGQSRNREIQRGGASDREIRKCNMGASWASRAKRRPAGDSRIEKIKKSRKHNGKSRNPIGRSRNREIHALLGQGHRGWQEVIRDFQDRENREIEKTQWKIKKSNRAIEKSRNRWLVGKVHRGCAPFGFLDFLIARSDFLIFPCVF